MPHPRPDSRPNCRPNHRCRPPAPAGARLFAALPGFVSACLVAPVPFLATAILARDPVVEAVLGSHVLIALLFLPFAAFFVGMVAGPIALPVLLVMAARDVRGVRAHAALGALVTLPPLAVVTTHTTSAPTGAEMAAVVVGGAIGGIAASVVRDATERLWTSRWDGIPRWHGDASLAA